MGDVGDGGTDPFTCTPTTAVDTEACDPTYDCCGFPSPIGPIGYSVGTNSCASSYSTGTHEYEIECENLGSDAAVCNCSTAPI